MTELQEKFNYCENSYLQRYDCAKSYRPDWNREKHVCIDKCLISEIFDLWDQGIITTGCCCGNHKDSSENSSFIGVRPEFIPKMKELGYQVRFNVCRPNDEDSFIPKTKFPAFEIWKQFEEKAK